MLHPGSYGVAAGQIEQALARFKSCRREQGRREFAARARSSQIARTEPVVAGAFQALELLRIETHGSGASGRAAAALSRATLYTPRPIQIVYSDGRKATVELNGEATVPIAPTP